MKYALAIVGTLLLISVGVNFYAAAELKKHQVNANRYAEADSLSGVNARRADSLSTALSAIQARVDTLAKQEPTVVILPMKLKLRHFAPVDTLRAVWDKPMD